MFKLLLTRCCTTSSAAVLPYLVHEDVGRLQVAVDDPGGVQAPHRHLHVVVGRKAPNKNKL